jgi:hypothetical protein
MGSNTFYLFDFLNAPKNQCESDKLRAIKSCAIFGQSLVFSCFCSLYAMDFYKKNGKFIILE